MHLWHCLAVNEEVSFTNKPVHSIPFYLSQQRHINSLGKIVIICDRCFHSGFHMLAFIIKMYGTTSAGSLIQSQSGKQKVCRVVRANVQRCHLLLWSTHYQLELLLSGCELTSKSDLPSKWQQPNQLAARVEMKVAGGLFVLCRKALTACLALTCFPANISHFFTKLVSLLRFDLGALFLLS